MYSMPSHGVHGSITGSLQARQVTSSEIRRTSRARTKEVPFDSDVVLDCVVLHVVYCIVSYFVLGTVCVLNSKQVCFWVN